MFILALLFYFVSFIFLIFYVLFILKNQKILWLLSLLIAQGFLALNIQLFASYTLYGSDVYGENYIVANTLWNGRINFQNAFGAALYDSVLIPLVCMVSGISPLVFYKAIYIVFLILYTSILYLILNILCKNKINLKLSMIYPIFITFTLLDSLRFGIALVSYLALLLLIIRVITKQYESYSGFLAILLISSSLTLNYYTLGLNSLILLLLLCFILFFSKGVNDALKKAFFLTTAIALISSFLYVFYISLILSQHILNTIDSLLRYSFITEERVEYTLGGQGFSLYIRSLVKYFPHAVSLLGIALGLYTLAFEKEDRSRVISTKNNGKVLIWLSFGLILTIAATFVRTGFTYAILVFIPLFTLGIYNVYSYFTSLPTIKVRKLLTLALITALLVTMFLGPTNLVDTLLRLDTSSPVLDKTSVYRGGLSTEISDYYMLKFLLINLPGNKLVDLYSDTKISNSIISVASDLYPNQLTYEPTSININPYALLTFLKNKNIKGMLILSTYNVLTGDVIIPQGVVAIYLNDILVNYNLVYNGPSLILSRS